MKVQGTLPTNIDFFFNPFYHKLLKLTYKKNKYFFFKIEILITFNL
jgi:hypothetical protein